MMTMTIMMKISGMMTAGTATAAVGVPTSTASVTAALVTASVVLAVTTLHPHQRNNDYEFLVNQFLQKLHFSES